MRSERGQILPLVAVVLVALVGLAAFAIDLGVAYMAKRDLQSSVDSAALAGAYDLSDIDPAVRANAITDASAYAAPSVANDSVAASYTVTTACVNRPGVTVCNSTNPNTVTVDGAATTNTWFARLFGIDHIDVHAHSQAYGSRFAPEVRNKFGVVLTPAKPGLIQRLVDEDWPSL